MRVLALAFSLLTLAGTGSRAAEIRVTGSDLLGEAFTRAVTEFSRQNDTAVKLNLPGTRLGVEDMQAGRADVGLFLLPAGERAPLEKLVSRVIAYQVAVVVVPAAAPLRQVTVPQLRGLFAPSTGEAFSHWSDLNLSGDWGGRTIALLALAPKAGLAFPLFQQAILAGGETRSGLGFVDTAAALAVKVAASENTIGVTGVFGTDTAGLRVLPLAAGPTDPAYAPTLENVNSGSYPLRMPLYVTFRREARADLQLFLKFLLSDEGAAALAPAHFLPLPTGVRNQLVFELEEMR